MSDPEVINDRERYADVGREYRQLEPAHELVVEYRRAESDMEGAKDLVDEDDEFAELYDTSKARIAELEEEIRMAMIDRDPNDDKDVIIELRPGTGGEEAATSPPISTACSPLRRASEVQVRDCSKPTTAAITRLQSRATAPTASSSTRAARTAFSAFPKPSPRAASTLRQRPSP